MSCSRTLRLRVRGRQPRGWRRRWLLPQRHWFPRRERHVRGARGAGQHEGGRLAGPRRRRYLPRHHEAREEGLEEAGGGRVPGRRPRRHYYTDLQEHKDRIASASR